MRSLGIILNSVADVQNVTKKMESLIKKSDHFHTVYPITGQTRACERPSAQDLNQDGIVIVATQTVEAGVDFSVSHMITEMSPLSSTWQRIGRMNRYGERDESHCYLLVNRDKNGWGSGVSQAIYGSQSLDPLGVFFTSDTFYDEESIFTSPMSHLMVPSFLEVEGTDKVDVQMPVTGIDCGLSHQEEVEDAICQMSEVSKRSILPYSPQPIYVTEDVVRGYLSTSLNKAAGDISGFINGIEEQDIYPRVSVAWRSVIDDDMTLLPGETVEVSVMMAYDLRKSMAQNGLLQGAKIKTHGQWEDLTFRTRITPESIIVFPSSAGGYTTAGVNKSYVNKNGKFFVDDISLHLVLDTEEGMKTPFIPVSESNLSYALQQRGVSEREARSTWEKITKVMSDIEEQVTDKISGLRKIRSIMKSAGCEVAAKINDNGDLVFSRAFKGEISHGENGVLSLDAHLSQTGDIALSMASSVGLDEGEIQAVSMAAYGHDAGKAHPDFQKMLGALPGEVLAKSTGRISIRLTNPAPLHDIEGSVVAEDDLTKWIIADHHGRARGVSRRDIPGSLSFISLRKDLEDRYGIFGLAYLESIVRLADWTSSALPNPSHSVNPHATAFIDRYLDHLEHGVEPTVESGVEVILPGLAATYIPAWYATATILCKGQELGEIDSVRWEGTTPVFTTRNGNESISRTVSEACKELAEDYLYAAHYFGEKWDKGIGTKNQKFSYQNTSDIIEMYRHLHEEKDNIFASILSPWISAGSGEGGVGKRFFISPFLAANSSVFFESDLTSAYQRSLDDHDDTTWSDIVEMIVKSLYDPFYGWEEGKTIYSLNINGSVTNIQRDFFDLALYGGLIPSIFPRGLGDDGQNNRLLPLPDHNVDGDQLWAMTASLEAPVSVFGENNREKSQLILPGVVVQR